VLTRSGGAHTYRGGLRRRHGGGRHPCGFFVGGGGAETLAGAYEVEASTAVPATAARLWLTGEQAGDGEEAGGAGSETWGGGGGRTRRMGRRKRECALAHDPSKLVYRWKSINIFSGFTKSSEPE
jgi:hypothetical protein